MQGDLRSCRGSPAFVFLGGCGAPNMGALIGGVMRQGIRRLIRKVISRSEGTKVSG
jgi:hypothetical protein